MGGGWGREGHVSTIGYGEGNTGYLKILTDARMHVTTIEKEFARDRKGSEPSNDT